MLPQGIAETVTTVIDLGAGTNYTDAVTRGFNKMRDDLGIDPAGAGKITEGLVQFGVPGMGATVAVSEFSKLGKLAQAQTEERSRFFKNNENYKTAFRNERLVEVQKLGLAAQQFLVLWSSGSVVATDGTQI